jgi:hypothetical protein
VFPVYGGECWVCKAHHNLVEKFCQGHSKIADDAQSGYSIEIATEVTVQWMEELIRADRSITIGNVAAALV